MTTIDPKDEAKLELLGSSKDSSLDIRIWPTKDTMEDTFVTHVTMIKIFTQILFSSVTRLVVTFPSREMLETLVGLMPSPP